MCESLAEECEAVEEARPSRSVVGINGLHLCRDESFLMMQR
jgi:hypothetical protein